MFTGRYYSEVARTPDTWSKIHGSNVLLAERLKAAGYLTAGIPSHRFFLPHYGLHQGFEQWDLSIVEKFQQKVAYRKTGQFVTERAAKWLREYDSEGRPFFLWLHYFDAHFAYLPHPQYDFGDSPFDRYDAEIRYTDEQVGRLLKALSQSPLAADTYVIIQSDHGEGFGDHGYQYHGQELFNDQVHVPLVIAGPGIKARQVMTPVSLLDIVPTVLDVESPLLNYLDTLWFHMGPPMSPPRTPVYIEMLKDATHSERRVIVDWPWKRITASHSTSIDCLTYRRIHRKRKMLSISIQKFSAPTTTSPPMDGRGSETNKGKPPRSRQNRHRGTIEPR